MAGFEENTKTSRAGRFPPPRCGPRRRSRLGLLTALDAVDARRLRQFRDQHPCLHDLASSTAVRLFGFVAQTEKPVFHRRLRPRSRSGRHICRPARAPVPAALHRRPPSTARSIGHSTSTAALRRHLTLVYLQPKTKHTITRTVDNSLITGRIEYSHSSISPLMSALSTHHLKTEK